MQNGLKYRTNQNSITAEIMTQPSPSEERLLANWAKTEDLIELVIYYQGGHVRLFGRVVRVPGMPEFLSVGGATFPIHATVRQESVGQGWIYYGR